MNMQAVVPAILAGIAGALVFMIETNCEMRTVRELEKRKRMKNRWLAKQDKLQDGRNELDDELHEKNTALCNRYDREIICQNLREDRKPSG